MSSGHKSSNARLRQKLMFNVYFNNISSDCFTLCFQVGYQSAKSERHGSFEQGSTESWTSSPRICQESGVK